MADIDFEKSAINGRFYREIRYCRNKEDYTENKNYLFVIKRNIETAFTTVTNIYCVDKGQFLFDTWHDNIDGGYIYENKYVYVSDSWYDSKGEYHTHYNKVDITNGEFLLIDWVDNTKDYKKMTSEMKKLFDKNKGNNNGISFAMPEELKEIYDNYIKYE